MKLKGSPACRGRVAGRTGNGGEQALGERDTSDLRIPNSTWQTAGVDRIASWSQRLVDGLIKRAVMEGNPQAGPKAF